jgi:ethanolamine permease
MVALLRLRKKEPTLERPFRVPLYPASPVIALVIAGISFIAMTVYNFKLAVVYCILLIGTFLIYKLIGSRHPGHQNV